MVTKRATKKQLERRGYLQDEAADMERSGYLTVKAAADMFNVRVDRVYRAINQQKIRVKIGDNAYTRYVHRGDWSKLVEKQREKVKAGLGLA